MANSNELCEAMIECLQNQQVLQLIMEKIVLPAVKSAVAEAINTKDKVINTLQDELVEAKNKLTKLEQHSIRKNVCITGIEELPGENPQRLVENLARSMDVHVSPDDVEAVHRIGVPSHGKNRTILLKFNTFKKREEFFNAKKMLRRPDRGSRIFVNEHLTSTNSRLFFEARKLKKNGKLFATWVKSGKIMIKIAETGRVIHIQSIEEILSHIGSVEPMNCESSDHSESTPTPPQNNRTPLMTSGGEKKSYSNAASTLPARLND